jgi:site-specific DNA recombinase
MNLPTKAIAIYLRVSTKKQDTNTSKETQLNAINNFITEKGLSNLPKFIYQDTESASRNLKSTNIDDDRISVRSDLNQLILDAKIKKFDGLFVHTHDRLSRNVRESLLLTFLFKKLKIPIFYCKPGEVLDSGNNKFNIFFDQLLNNLSQLESSLIASRVKLGNEYNIYNGFWAGGNPPYGYKLKPAYQGKRKSVLQIVYSEARIVKEIFSLYSQGHNPENIADIIKDRYPHNKDRLWNINSVKSILANRSYTGLLVYNKKGGVRNPVRYKNPIESITKVKSNEIITDDYWKKVLELKACLRNNPKHLSTPFILKDLIVCGKCGKPLKCKNNGGNRGRVYYCIKERGQWETCLNADYIENKVVTHIGEQLVSILLNDITLNNFYERYSQEFHSRKELYIKQQIELEEQLKANKQLLSESEIEIHVLNSSLDTSNSDIYKEQIEFLDSLNEYKTFLNINQDRINCDLLNVKKILDKPLPDIGTIQVLLQEKSKMLNTLKDNAFSDISYRRSLRIILFNLIEKITVLDSINKIDIIFK